MYCKGRFKYSSRQILSILSKNYNHYFYKCALTPSSVNNFLNGFSLNDQAKIFWLWQTGDPNFWTRQVPQYSLKGCNVDFGIKCIIQCSYDICFVKIILRHNFGEKFKQREQTWCICLPILPGSIILEFGPPSLLPLINSKFPLTIYMSKRELLVL